MRQLTLIAIPDCPLSAQARQVLDTLAADGLLAWHEATTGTPNGEALQRNAPELLPALFNDSGVLLAHGRLSEWEHGDQCDGLLSRILRLDRMT